MVAAAKKFKKHYPNLIHITCLTHAHHNVCDIIRTYFQEIERVVQYIQAMFAKSNKTLY